MLYNNFIENFIGLQGLVIKKIENEAKNTVIYGEMERKQHYCISCGIATDAVHDYREQIIKDIPAFGKNVTIVLRKRRYRCPHCGKRFFEENTFLPRYHRMTNRLVSFVLDKLTDERSFTSVSREVALSVSTIIRIFDLVSYLKIKNLPKALSIDEFKGNTWGEKYQCILTDPVNKVVLDILPERYGHYLTDYFKAIPKSSRNNVEYFVSDMRKTYSDTASVWFKNATKIVDKYHWIRQAVWAFEKIRKEEQKKLSPELRKHFKRSKSLLIKRFDSLKDEDKQAVNVMLYYSVNLSRAYWYKEKFLKLLSCSNSIPARKAISEWIQAAEYCGLKPFEKCADTMKNWYAGIINSFDSPITNGFTEGCNNNIKVLKRNAYGYKNFKRFRNRILHIFSHQKQKSQAVA